ncbi:MAG: FmdE family protein [Candidatus Omnitrophota bacterium]
MKSGITLKEAIKFHGHLGPYLVLGILAGLLALKKLRCKKYFGLKVIVQGALKKPKSCLIDGLQLSTGATYGKGNIRKLDGREIKIDFRGPAGYKKVTLKLRKALIQRLEKTQTHKDSELLAKQLYNTDPLKLFI